METEQFDSNISLQWDVLDFCNNKHLYNCAKYLCQFVQELNGISRDYKSMKMDKQDSDDKYKNLSDKLKRQESNCENCTDLQKKLHSQNSKFKTIASIFGQLTAENGDGKNGNVSLERAQDMLTQMGDEYNRIIGTEENVISSRNAKQKRSPLNENMNKNSEENDLFYSKTPNKKVCVRNDELVNFHTSPILKKGKSNKMFWNDSPSKKSPNLNLATKYQTDDGNKKSSGKENQHTEIDTSSPEIIEDVSDTHDSPPKTNNKPKKSLSLLHSKTPSLKKSDKDKGFRQARLTFIKEKPKVLLDVSREESFCGGIRNAVNDDHKKSVKDTLPPLTKKPSYEDSLKMKDDIDVIDESPSCDSKSMKKRSKLSSKRSGKVEESNKCIGDNDTTFLSDSLLNVGSSAKIKSEKKTPSPNRKPIKKPLEVIYKEEPIRKKADKEKVPGWSCKKCIDFYSVAFKGNDEMIQKKINECSKHRGKFNPERSKTPPGFWNVDMLPTQDTETINRLNNQDLL